MLVALTRSARCRLLYWTMLGALACEAPSEADFDEGSEDADDEVDAADEIDAEVAPLGDVVGPTSVVVGTVTGEPALGGGYGYPSSLRVGGAYLHPARRFAVAFVEAHGVGNRRIEYKQLDADPASATYGSLVGPFLYASFGSGDMQGMASTSVTRGAQTDGVFAYYDAGEILVFEANGSTGAITTPSVVRTSAGFFFGGQHETIPALEAGRWGATSRVLLADASWYINLFTGTTYNWINFGLLQRAADGSYTATATGSKAVQPAGAPLTCSSPVYNIDAAYDSVHHEWTVAWMCGVSVYMQRLDWNAVPVGEPFLLAWDPSDNAHSGVMLSYNKNVDRFLVQFQHNLRVARRFGASYRCVDKNGNDVGVNACSSNDTSDRVPPFRIVTGGVWASAVDYRPGAYFRVGGRCLGSCESEELQNHGVSYSMEWLDVWGLNDPDVPSGWVREPGTLWAPNSRTSLHRYVRGSDVGRNALVYVNIPSNSPLGTVRATFADEAAVAVDE